MAVLLTAAQMLVDELNVCLCSSISRVFVTGYIKDVNEALNVQKLYMSSSSETVTDW